MLPKTDAEVLVARYGELIRGLQALLASLRGPKSEA